MVSFLMLSNFSTRLTSRNSYFCHAKYLRKERLELPMLLIITEKVSGEIFNLKAAVIGNFKMLNNYR